MAFTIRSTDRSTDLVLGHYGVFITEQTAARVADRIRELTPVKFPPRYEVVPLPEKTEPKPIHPVYTRGITTD